MTPNLGGNWMPRRMHVEKTKECQKRHASIYTSDQFKGDRGSEPTSSSSD